MLRRLMMAVGAVGLAACAAPPGTPGAAAAGATDPALAGTRWVGAMEDSADPRSAPRLEFVSGGRVAGYTGCNMLSGAWRLEGGEVRFGPMTTTKRLCLGPEGDAERRLLAVLGESGRVARAGAKLVLTGPGGARFEFTPAR